MKFLIILCFSAVVFCDDWVAVDDPNVWSEVSLSESEFPRICYVVSAKKPARKVDYWAGASFKKKHPANPLKVLAGSDDVRARGAATMFNNVMQAFVKDVQEVVPGLAKMIVDRNMGRW